jgi:glycosyltransferase involved in cell wall biosynthesis
MCLHDNTLAAALLDAGEEVLLIPTYTPIRTDEHDVSLHRVFFGGINVYLQHKMSLFRHTPWFFDALLDSPKILNWASSRAVSIDPAQLGDLTVAMLEGPEGNLRKELAKLVRWLAEEVKPDVVHLSNAMLMAFAGEIARATRAPIVCSLSGEDVFLERIVEPYYTRARTLMKRWAGDVAAFVSLNRYYADFMIDYVSLDAERVHVVRHGLNLEGHGRRRTRPDAEPVTMGFFARVCHDKGLHQLADAFLRLRDDPSLPPLRLHVAGYLAAADKPYLAGIESKLHAAGVGESYQYLGELDRSGKIEFLQSLDVMSVPTVYRESKGLSVLEAMANGVPVVVPNHGTFPELIADTRGGLLFEAGHVDSLADALRRLIVDRELNKTCGENAWQAIRDRYHAKAMAQETLALYRRVLAENGGTPASVAAGRFVVPPSGGRTSLEPDVASTSEGGTTNGDLDADAAPLASGGRQP